MDIYWCGPADTESPVNRSFSFQFLLFFWFFRLLFFRGSISRCCLNAAANTPTSLLLPDALFASITALRPLGGEAGRTTPETSSPLRPRDAHLARMSFAAGLERSCNFTVNEMLWR